MEEEEINAKLSSSQESFSPREEAGGHNQRQLLTKLVSELRDESKQEARVDDDDTVSSEIDEKTNTTSDKEDGGCCCSNEEIMKEVKNIRRQNSITHYLLTAMILVTLAWQLSEVSLVFKIKHGLSNPLKSVGGLIKGFFRSRRRHEATIQDVMKQASETQKQIMEPIYLPDLKIPELPHFDLLGFDTSDDDDD